MYRLYILLEIIGDNGRHEILHFLQLIKLLHFYLVPDVGDEEELIKQKLILAHFDYQL